MDQHPFSLDFAGPGFDALCEELRGRTGELEEPGAWPGGQFELLAGAGVLGWVIPRHYGGTEIAPEELTLGYERLAAACLTTTFVLTQRNGACQRVAGCDNDELKADLLPRLCAGEAFATVGISHLTTSRQHLKQPAVRAELDGDEIVLDGVIPWVTGGAQADYILTGGTCADNRQVLMIVPTATAGVSAKNPAPLLALNASHTGAVQLENVRIERRFLVAGPVEAVMKQGKGGGAGSLTTSALAVGTAAAALRHLHVESGNRPDLVEICNSIENEWARLSAEMYEASKEEVSVESPAATSETIRQQANSLVLRATQAYLAASKGAGFVKGHPAERLVREAMFFLVWSCPQPVLRAALRQFACLIDD